MTVSSGTPGVQVSLTSILIGQIPRPIVPSWPSLGCVTVA
jgi:hypothetical protein